MTNDPQHDKVEEEQVLFFYLVLALRPEEVEKHFQELEKMEEKQLRKRKYVKQNTHSLVPVPDLHPKLKAETASMSMSRQHR